MTLKPCPFCGGEAALEGAGPGESHWISCNTDDCSGIGHVYGSAETTAAAWNRRTAPEGGVARDAARLKWLEDNYTLHKSVEILYVVDGYEITLMHEDGVTELSPRFYGETFTAAIDAAMGDCVPQSGSEPKEKP